MTAWIVVCERCLSVAVICTKIVSMVCITTHITIVHGCMVYTERAEMAAVSCGTSHASAVSTPLWWILKKHAIKS